MARGPFSSSGNQAQEIAGVQLVGGFAPTPGIVDAIGAVAKIAIPAIKKNHIDNLKEDITGQTSTIKKFLQLARNPELLTSEFGVEAVDNPAVRDALARFVEVKNATKQGKLPGQFALERLQVIQSDAIANAPEFEQEIRAAMIAATGQDPQKRLFSQLLSDQAAGMSPEAKFQQDLSFAARRKGITVEALIEGNNDIHLASVAKAQFGRASTNGTMDLFKVSGEVNRTQGVIMMGIMDMARTQMVSAGGLTDEFSVMLKQRLSAVVTTANAEIMSAAGDFVDPTDLAKATAPLLAMQQQVEAMIDDGSMRVLVSNTNGLNKGLILGEAMQFKDFAIAHAMGGERGFLEVYKFFEQATNPQTRALLDKLNPKAEAATLFGRAAAGVQLVPSPVRPMGVVRQYGLLGTGVQGLADAQVNERILAANIAVQTVGGREEAHTAGMNDLESISGEHAWRAFESRRTMAAAMQSKALQAKLIPLQANQTAGLGTEFNALRSLPGFRDDNFNIVGGQLTYTIGKQQGQGQRLEIDNEAPAFVKRFNRANKISSMYAGVGILPASRYTNIQSYLKVVKEAVPTATKGETPSEKATGPRRVVRGTDGKLSFE